MYKKITAIFVLICLLLSVTSAYAEHWADSTIKELYDRGFIAKLEDAAPDESITRAEFVKLINKCFNYKVQLVENYPDVFQTKWYYKDFGIAKYIGYLTGDENGNANPESFMTRAECAAMIGRILDSRLQDERIFNDHDQIPVWSADYISQLSALSIINCYPDGSFRPNGQVTRAEAFTIIAKVDSMIRFEEGDGTPEKPYVVKTPYQFNHIRDYVWESGMPYFVLEADIDLTEIRYMPIGDQRFPFQGVLDGQGHSVQYDTFDIECDYGGLFAYNAGTIKSLKVSGRVTGYTAAGVIAAQNEGNILYCTAEGIAYTQNNTEKTEITAGGIAGVNSGYIYACYNRSDVSLSDLKAGSTGYAGGICGYNNREISGSINGGTIEANVEDKGDIAGVNVGVLSNNYAEKDASLEFLDRAVWNVKDGELIQSPFIQKKPFQNGSGTESDPYQISTPEEFSSVRFRPEACYQLTQNIDLTNYPGFTFFEEFSGVLDGQGHQISHLTLDRSNTRKSGLIVLNHGTLKNLRLEQCNISGRTHIAGFVNTNYGNIENCSVSGTLQLKNEKLANINLYLGAIAAENGGTIINCTNEAAVIAESSASDCRLMLGGIAGENTKVIDQSKNSGGIRVNAEGEGSRLEIGGITGKNTAGDIYDSKNLAAVSSNSQKWVAYTAGIAAFNTGSITNCSNSGEIKAESDASSAIAGGIAAQNERAVELSVNTGTIQSVSQSESASSGGITGRNSDWVSSCSNSGTISASILNQEFSSIAGGIAGQNAYMVSNCSNSGTISAQGGEALKGDICGLNAQTE